MKIVYRTLQLPGSPADITTIYMKKALIILRQAIDTKIPAAFSENIHHSQRSREAMTEKYARRIILLHMNTAIMTRSILTAASKSWNNLPVETRRKNVGEFKRAMEAMETVCV